jgi:CheY-like chemotaxis protein/anti-sigma regulatory factor (Ser/Thr protein kinase)
VDDAEDIRRLVRTALRFRGGFELVGEAANGEAAVALADELRPDVVVLDLGLPDIAGDEVLTRIRTLSPSTKVVVFSGTEAHDRAWFEERVVGYVLKDADLDFLIDVIERSGAQADETSIELPRDLSSVGRARGFVADALATTGDDELVDDAHVVVSELVTNAVTHGRSGCVVRVGIDDSAVRISVVDRGLGTPDPKPFSGDQPNGRGLHIVGALARAWGVTEVPDGKVVWAEMSRSPAEPTSAVGSA